MLRVIFFGMSGRFSIPPLEMLLDHEIEIQAVIVPGKAATINSSPRRLLPTAPPASDLPLINPHLERNIIHLAWQHNIPVWEVASLSTAQVVSWLSTLAPDLIVVACFSLIFPPDVLTLPQYGCLNLHPSLLPAYRGPAPLFWMARRGESQAGVTLHLLDRGLDSGDIVAQHAFAWPEGISEAALEQQCAIGGTKLLKTTLNQLKQGQPLPRRPQSPTGASYFSWPDKTDFYIPTTWSARRAFNFLKFGVGNWPLWIEAGSQQIFVKTVIDYSINETLGQPWQTVDNQLHLQFSPGVLRVIPAVRF